MKPIVSSSQLIGACGLYCGACRKYLKDKCPGCQKAKSHCCPIGQCCIRQGFHTCADCHIDANQCKTYNNIISRLFRFLFNSDRATCIRYIRRHGEQAFADRMTMYEQMTMKRKR